MKKKHKKSKKIFPYLIGIAALVTAVVLTTEFVDFDKLFHPDAKEPASPVVNTPSNPTTVDPTPEPTPTPDPTPEPTTVPEKEKVVQYGGEDPNKSEEVTGVITYLGKNGARFSVRVNIDQYLQGGTCTLYMIQDGVAKYTATANVVDAAATSTCQGFDIPLTELPSGHVNVKISIATSTKSGTITGEANL